MKLAYLFIAKSCCCSGLISSLISCASKFSTSFALVSYELKNVSLATAVATSVSIIIVVPTSSPAAAACEDFHNAETCSHQNDYFEYFLHR